MNINFFILLLLSYLLPKDKITNNINKSITIIESEGLYYTPYYKNNNNLNKFSTLDNFTDSIILNVALDNNLKNTNILKKTVLNSYYKNSTNEISNLKTALSNDTKPNTFYIRYWFEIESILKFLLVFNDYMEIRFINMICINLLLIFISYLITKKLGFKYVIPFVLSLLFMSFNTISMSLQYSPVTYIMILSIIVILLLNKKINKYYKYLFLVIGGLTAYFDLLTFPLITLGYPLIIVLLLKLEDRKFNFKKDILLFISLIILWGIGYGGTYIFKWAISSVILNQNCFITAFDRLGYRMNYDSSQDINLFLTIKNNFDIYFNKYTLTLLLFMLITLLLIVIIRKARINRYKFNNILPLLLIMTSPYLWYIIMSNHSYIHAWMSNKIQGITLFSFLSIIMLYINFKKSSGK